MKPPLENLHVSPEALDLVWSDGVRKSLAAPFLRGHCQCASCVSEVNGQLLIDRAKISPEIKITKAEPMGHYAVALAFSDFHATGIYTYDYLRRLAE